MVRRVSNQPKRHSQRIAAWIYAVINPVWEGLQREIELLERGNTTWRYYSRRCEFIRPVQEYVDNTQWPNYSDFLVENSDFKDSFHSHDEALQALNNSADALFGWLLSFPRFNDKLELCVREYEERRSSDPLAPDLAHSNDELRKSAAEYLINNIQTLPHHYSFSKFWALASSSMFELASMKNFEAVRSAAGRLKSTSQQLKTALEDQRLTLSRKYDLPAAPIPDFLSRR
jgi:hypothetical protein